MTQDEARGRQRALRTMALYALAFVFLAIILWRTQIWNAGDSLDDVSGEALVAVIAMCIVPAIPLAIRGREMLLALGYRLSAVSLAPVSFYGNTAGFLTPASSGELLRPSLLERGFNVPVKEGAGVVVYERLYSFFLLALAAALALTWTDFVPAGLALALLPVFAIASLAPPLVFGISRNRVPMDRPGRMLPGWIRSRLGSVEETGTSLKRLLESGRLALAFVVTSWTVFALMVLQFWLLVEGVGEEITPAEAGVVLIVANLAGVLSALPLGLGAMDVTMVALLRAYGVDTDAALGIVILVRCLIHLPTGILGLMAYLIALRKRAPAVAPGEQRREVKSLTNTDARV